MKDGHTTERAQSSLQDGTDGVKIQIKERNSGRKKRKGEREDWKRSR